MARRSPEVDIVIVGVLVGALVIQSSVNAALPDQIFDHRLGLEHLLDARELDRLGRITIDQGHLAILRGVQRLGHLPGVGILFDQQVLVTLKGFHLAPVDRYRTGVLGLDQQLSAIEQNDLATQLVTVLQPDGISKQGHRSTDDSETQQGSGQHKQIEALDCEKSRHYP
ncbi:hypothetical protein D3C81_1764470 [compost metagenome]